MSIEYDPNDITLTDEREKEEWGKGNKWQIQNYMVDNRIFAGLTEGAKSIHYVLLNKVHSVRLDRIMSREELMRLSGIKSKTTFANAIKELVDKNLLELERGYNAYGPRKYRLKHPG